MRRAPLRLLVGPVMAAVVIVVVANVVAFVGWTAPRWSARWSAAGVSGSVESARQRVEPAVAGMRDTYGRLRDAAQDLDLFRRQLINTAGGSDLLAMLVNAGDKVGLELDDEDFRLAPVEELGVVRLEISVPVSGSYRAVRGLLDELVDLPVFLVIDAVSLQAEAGGNLSSRIARSADETIRVDLVLSVFVDDPEPAAGSRGAATPTSISAAAARDAETLRRAALGNDPDEIADALSAGIGALPPLPVDAESLRVRLDRLGAAPASLESSRDLFSVVRPPVPPTAVAVETPAEVAAPEPAFPVRLVGVLLIDGRWHASLTDDVALFIAETGDLLPNGVQVVEVGADYVELELGDRRTRLTLEGTRS